jgi:hypothetical protein
MSEIKVDKINNLAGTGAANFTYGIKVGGVAQSIGSGTFTSSDTEPTSPSDGDVWYQPTLMYLDYRAGGEWKRVVGSGTSNPIPYFGDRMLTAGGNTSNSPYKTNAIRYIDITGSGGSTSFGSLSANRSEPSGVSGGGRGLFASGIESNFTNAIEYVTISTTGNGSSFGTLLSSTSNLASASNGTTAIFSMGNNSHSGIEKVTIATTGNATSWSGSLTASRNSGSAASDGTKGFFIGGYTNNPTDTIDYVTIATEANAADWGDLITARNGMGPQAACGNNSRILVGGGYTSSLETSSIEYFSPATAGNAYSFGNLTTVARLFCSACNDTKAVWAGGWNGSVRLNMQNIVTIDTAANASTFGSFAFGVSHNAGLSGAAS